MERALRLHLQHHPQRERREKSREERKTKKKREREREGDRQTQTERERERERERETEKGRENPATGNISIDCARTTYVQGRDDAETERKIYQSS